ncbi:hypothetical protein [Kribbella solani]|uniref:Uncharacterized protein n=1 Tax=Kribbella solani TaxID=236067 RepID=A0A841DNV5_9ACTN|nr:hypothetical protein [Kribbella solani]MBB5977148.1 hypothetical protein [Kribbella solani]
MSEPAGDVGTQVDDVGTQVNESSGPIHAGTGDQLNDITYFLNLPREARTREITSIQLRRLWGCFVQPPNFDRAAAQLAQPEGLVILDGPTGTGRRTAGLMLLSVGITPDLAVRFIPPELELHAARAERRIFEGKDVRDGDRLLLDLSEVAADTFAEQQSTLHDLQSALVRRRAKLVVILPHSLRDRLGTDFRPHVVDIGRPDMSKVLERQLAAHGICLRNTSSHRGTFASTTMAALVRVVYEVVDASRTQPDAEADVLLSAVLSSGQRRAQLAAKAVRSADEARPRALLIAAALLHGQSVVSVFLAQHRLLEQLRPPNDDGEHPLELSGVAGSLDDLGLELVVTADQRLEFAERDIAADVLQRFWDDMPWLRAPLVEWLVEQPSTASAMDFEVVTVAKRFGAQCRRSRQAALALQLVEQWSTGGRNQRVAAYALLEDLLDDDQTASPARQLLYGWARDSHLSADRAAIVVAACVNIVFDRYPDQAVVRLSWLAEHSDNLVRYEAREGLSRLAEDPARQAKVIDLILDARRFKPSSFAAVATPAGVLSLADGGAVERVLDGWQRALTEVEPVRRAALLRPWLQAHADLVANGRTDDAARLLQLLASVCGQQRELFDLLHNTTLDWVGYRRDDPARRWTADAVVKLVRHRRRVAGTVRLEAGV